MDFRILGPVEVVVDGSALALGGPKQRAVLALLLVHRNEALSIDRLAEELWGERQPATARKTVRVYISRLRKLLGERIENPASGYRLTVGDGELDVDRLERLRAQARELSPAERAEALAEALGLFRGPPLAEFVYEEWAQAESARLGELRLICLEERIDADLGLGRHAELAAELESLVAAHPLRERFRSQLMVALYRAGRQAEALQAYRDARERLVQELGIDPGPELQQLELAILRQDPELVAPAVAAAEEAPADEPRTPVREARKTVTALVCDVVRLTAPADPEALRSILARYFESVSAVVQRHGGTVEKSIGDAVLAVFGVPTVHEDDVLRAVRAGVEIDGAIDRLNAELSTAFEVQLGVRIGIATGEVLVGSTVPAAPPIAGEAVNLAAALQQRADVGEILLGEESYRLVRDAVRAQAAAPVGAKGEPGPVAAYRVLELLPAASPITRRLDTPLVGRSYELGELRHVFEQAVSEQNTMLLTVLGAAGIGKSRLVSEFARSVTDEATVVTGQCLPYGDGITFWPLAEIVRELAGDEIEAGVQRLLGDAEDASAVARLVAGMVGAAEVPATGQESFWAGRRLLEALARARPLVVVLEDIHWAEPTLLDFVEHVAEWARGVPLALVCLARTELLEDRPGWGGGANARSIALQPLSDEECTTLVEGHAAGQSLVSETRDRVLAASEGNPLFLEQLLAFSAEEGGLEATMPPTIQALLGARLDRLPPEERGLLERAAIEGRQFHVDAFTALGAAPDDLGSRLLALIRKELIRSAAAAPLGGDACEFRHALLREVAYSMLPKAERADLHERFADWLSERVAERVAEYEEILGYHLEQAYGYRAMLGPLDADARRLGRDAARRFASAARRAWGRGDAAAAPALLERALVLYPDDDPERLELLPELGRVLTWAGRLDRAEAVLDEAIDRAGKRGDRSTEAQATLERALLRSYFPPEGTTLGLEQAARAAISVFEELGDERGLARAWRALGEVHNVACRYEARAEALERAAEHARRAGDRLEETRILAYLPASLYFGTTPAAEGIARCEEMLRELDGNPMLETSALLYLGGFRAMQGELDAARELYGRAKAIRQELGWGTSFASGTLVTGAIELTAGDPAAAERELRPTYDELQELGEKAILASVAGVLAHVAAAQGRDDEAEQLSRVGEEAGEADDVHAQVLWRTARAIALSRRGRTEEAVALASEAVRRAEDTDFLNFRGDALVALGDVLRSAGQEQEAAESLARALTLYESKGNLVAAGRTRTAIELPSPR